MNRTYNCNECGEEIEFPNDATRVSCPACGALIESEEQEAKLAAAVPDRESTAGAAPVMPWRDLVAFETSVEQLADKLSVLNIALGLYPFETCPECDGRVLERLKCLHWGLGISGIPELEDRVNELKQRGHDLEAEVAIHRRQIGHKLRRSREQKSREQEFLDSLLKVIVEPQSSSD